MMAVCMIWFLVRFVPEDFEAGLDRHASALGLSLDSVPWSVDWRRGILSANNLTVSLADGSAPMLEIPLVEVDFRPWRLLGGWRAAIYQVYLHRPTVHLRREADGALNWLRWPKIAAGQAASPGDGFALGRLYADVVEVAWWRTDGPIRMDNGVVTITGLQFPPVAADTRVAVAAHFRADGGKLSIVGEGQPFGPLERGGLPQVQATLQLQDVGPAVAEPLGLPATGALPITAGR